MSDAPARATSHAPGEMTTAVYVYGVLPASEATAPPANLSEGVGEPSQPLRFVSGHELCALVSDVPADWRAAGRADLEKHDRILSQFAEHGTLLPMRFGVVLDSDEHVQRDLLGRNAETLQQVLDGVRGRVQMSVKAFYTTEDGPLKDVIRARPELKQRSAQLERMPAAASQSARIALGREVSEAVEAQTAADERGIVERLAPHAVDVVVAPPASARMAANVQLLVDRDRREALDTAVGALSTELGDRLALRYLGPLPPYSFADLSLEGEDG